MDRTIADRDPGSIMHIEAKRWDPAAVIARCRDEMEAERAKLESADQELATVGITIDLSRKWMGEVPDEVVSIIKEEVERCVDPEIGISIMHVVNYLTTASYKASALP